MNKRVLIFANNALSKSNSNGRTLLNLLGECNKENLAQFYIQNDTPDFDVCNNYFFVSDSAVLRAFLKRESAGRVVCKIADEKRENATTVSNGKKLPRNPLTMLIRDFLWNRNGWRVLFNDWVKAFDPECVLLQAGDTPFLFNLALETAKKYRIPMLIYNSEDYYFKNYNYFKNSGITGVFYPIFRSKLKKATKTAINYATISIYISEDLKNIYDAEFSKPSVAIYTATDIEPVLAQSEKPIFSYLGNLGLERHVGLIKIAESLNKINSDYKLDVYGKIPNDMVKQAFDNCNSLNYCGLVSYERVKEVIAESLLVFHTESEDPFYVKDIRHGFTTKIADSLASGTCFVIFAPGTLSCTKYVKENNCGCVITEESELECKLREIIEDKTLRENYINNALNIVEKNHRAQKNQAKMVEIINNL